MVGDTTRFTRQDGVEETWRIMQPLLDDPPPARPYQRGSWGPAEADALLREGATHYAHVFYPLTGLTDLADVDLDSYDAVFVPGGHGPMEDLAVSDDLGRILATMLDAALDAGGLAADAGRPRPGRP